MVGHPKAIHMGEKSLAFIGNASAHESWGEGAHFKPRRFR
jgi:hypothetical protein